MNKSNILEIKTTKRINQDVIQTLLDKSNSRLKVNYVLAFTSQIIYYSIQKKTAYTIAYRNLKSLYGSSKATEIRKFLLEYGIISITGSNYTITEKYKCDSYTVTRLKFTSTFQNKFFSLQTYGLLPEEKKELGLKKIEEESDPNFVIRKREKYKNEILDEKTPTETKQNDVDIGNDMMEMIVKNEKNHQMLYELAQQQIKELIGISNLLREEINILKNK